MGRLLFKQEDMKEEGLLILTGNREGCCEEREKVVVVKLINCGRETYCSRDSRHGGRGGILWIWD